MNRCRLCVIPDTRPDTAFVDGICSGCIAHAARPKIDWRARGEILEQLLARARAVTRRIGIPYDCIVPSSGGKDSTYQVLTLIEMGARPLVVTATTCHLTPIGRRNIDNLALHATTIEYTPNQRVRRQLNRLGLEMVGDISWPEHVGIFTIPFKIAAAHGIPLMFYGENPQNQYGAPTTESQEARKLTMRWRSEFGGFLGLRPQDLVGVEGLTEEDLRDYVAPTDLDLEASGIEAHFLGQYLPWDSHGNANKAKAYGMEQVKPHRGNWWPHENLDNAQTGLHDYGMYLKYGFGRGAAQISVDIREGKIKREVALEWVELYDGAFPEIYAGVPLDDVLARLGINRTGLMERLDKFTNQDLFERAGKWPTAPHRRRA